MLAVNTPKGQQAEASARNAIRQLTSAEVSVAFLPNNSIAAIDGYLIRNGEIRCAFEAKSRQASIAPTGLIFKGKVYDTYLVTEEKITIGIELAKKQSINFSLIVYLELSNIILIFPIYIHSTKATMPYTAQTTRTQATVSGGSANRLNAFLPINLAQVIQL